MASARAALAANNVALGIGTPDAFEEAGVFELEEKANRYNVRSRNIRASSELSQAAIIQQGRARARASLLGGIGGAFGAIGGAYGGFQPAHG